MREQWVDVALARLPETGSCPACAAPLRSSRCDRCRLDLTGPLAFEIADASSQAVQAIVRRQVALDTLRAGQPDAAAWAAGTDAARARTAPPPVAQRPGARPGARPALAGAPVPGPRPAVAGPPPGLPRPTGPSHPSLGPGAQTGPTAQPPRSVGLQPVLAGAGAGLLAVATVVFVFFTFADDLALRAVVTGVVTVLTVAATVLLRSRGLRSSAESVGALVVVLALVDVELALSAGLLGGLPTALARALLLAVVVVGLGLVGDRARVRAWVTSAVVLAPLVPLVAAPAAGAAWAWAWALLATSLLTLVAAPVAVRSGPRVGSSLGGERRVLLVARAVAVPAAVLAGLAVPPLPGLPGASGAALVALGAALVSVVLRLVTRERAWFASGGAAAVVTAALLGTGGTVAWVGAVPSAAALAWLAVVALTAPGVVSGLRGRPLSPEGRADALLGGAVVALLGALPALALSGLRAADVLLTGTDGTAATLDDAPLGVGPLDPRAWGDQGFVTTGLVATHVALAAALVVTFVAGRLALRTAGRLPAPARRTAAPVVRLGRTLAPWLALVLVLGLVVDPRLAASTSLVLLALLAAALVVATARPAAPPVGQPRPGAAVRAVRRRVAAALRPAVGHLVPTPRTAVRRGLALVGPAERRVARAAALAGLVAAVVLLLAGSWVARPTAAAGAAVVGLLLLGARAVAPRPAHAALVGAAYAYALLVLGVTLGWAGIGGVAVLCTVSGVASLAALVVTLVPRVERDSWWAVLGVTAVPFVLGVLTVVAERTWWSVAACVAMLALEVVLVVSRRPGSATALRVLAGALVLPTASVGVVSAGALLLPGSGSPVVLPLVALLVAATVAGARPATTALALPTGRVAVETSAALTGLIAVGLAYGRPAAGSEIAVAVLLLLAAGTGVAARERDRRGEWWLAAGLATVALWTALAAAEVGLVEAYTAPPALAAIVVASALARRVRRWWELATAGLVLLVVPSVLVLGAAAGVGDVRAPLLVALGGAGVVAAVLLQRRGPAHVWSRSAALRLAGAGVLAATGGTVEALHVAHVPGGGAVFALGLAWALAGGAVALGAGVVGSRAVTAPRAGALRRWAVAPAAVLVVVGAVANVRPVWEAIVTVWLLEVALLALLVLGVRRALRGRPDLPPPWFTWLLALAAAIGAWSPRELRVEVFSLPLGAGLLVVGYLALAAAAGGPRTGGPAAVGPGAHPVGTTPSLGTWPVGFLGSWRTLAPGILAIVGPSVLATYTDARTWRAVLVIVLALAAVLVGTRKHLAAPFLLGVAVLPVEILVVFVSQLGTRISAGPWMLTLAAAGGLLLIIATYYERRIAAYDGAAAYLRDLR